MSLIAKVKSYLFSKGLSRMDFILILPAILLLFFCYVFSMPVEEALNKDTDISLGYSAKQEEDGLYYVLDSGHERIVCFDEKSNIKFCIENPSDKKSDLLYIDDFAVAEDGIYISATEWEDMLIARETILFYDKKGHYKATLADRDYSENITNKHRFYGISQKDGKPRYIECLENSFKNGESEIPYDNAFNAVSDAVFVGDTLYILDKKGIITAFSEGSREGDILYQLSAEEDKSIVPYHLGVDREGRIYFTDIRNSAVRLVDTAKKNSSVVFDGTYSLTVNVSETGSLLILEDEGLLVSDNGEKHVYCTLNKNAGMVLFQIVWLLALVIFVIIVVLLAVRILYNFLARKYSVPQIISFWVIGTVTVVSVFLCGMLINSFSTSYREKIEEQVESAAYMIANQISGKDIQQIEATGGFGGESYNRMCEVMDKSFTRDIDFYRQLYCNVLKLSEDGEKGYAVAYLDQSVGSYFPLDDVETEELKAVYKKDRAVWNQEVVDISGTYLSVKVPVHDDLGRIQGAVSVGIETYVITDILNDMKIKILMSIITILMLIWLVSAEVMSFATNHHDYKKNVEAGEKNVLPGHLIRLLVFLVFVAYNMTATFLPVYLIRRTDIFPAGMRDTLGALPITVNIFIIGVMSLFCANLVRNHGIRKILAVSALCSLAGNFLMFIIPNFFVICAGLVLDGIGVGLITNAIYVMLTYIKDEKNRTWGLTIYNGACLSGINFGMMLGSVLAVAVGHRPVFLIVAAIWFTMFVLTGYMVRLIEGMFDSPQEEGETLEKISIGKFVFNKPIMSFILLIQNPYIVFGSFVFYFIPIYCDSHGYSETICSLLIMLYSEVAVIGTDMLTERFTKLFGKYAMYAALLTNAVALAMYFVTPNMVGIIIALLLMGMSGAYGKPVQQNYFLELDKVKRYGEDKSMGIYNFSENIGESLGPIVFGRLMAAGGKNPAVLGFCGCVAGAAGIHYLLNRKHSGNMSRLK